MQSVDIYVPELRLAVEYQGQQHYEPVALFGGEMGFQLARARDDKKHALLAANNVELLRWRYDVPITMGALADRIVEFGLSLPLPAGR